MDWNDNQDCGFTRDSNWFRFRVGAIIIENNCLLLASNKKCNYYYSIGGGVHLGETAEEAIHREIWEETGVNYEIDHLAFVQENFFTQSIQQSTLKCHEISFHFLMKSRNSQELNSNSIGICGQEFMNWIPLEELKNNKIYPSFLAKKLPLKSNTIEHITTIER